MAKDPRDKIKTDGDKVRARYGKTTGASPGSKPAPPAKVTPKVRRKSISVKWEKKF